MHGNNMSNTPLDRLTDRQLAVEHDRLRDAVICPSPTDKPGDVLANDDALGLRAQRNRLPVAAVAPADGPRPKGDLT